mmetsp:Transcript_242/g.393  ORF Transcript_242/g.393 Transcript_242/m.393 type:complete len:99 (-) Transcript_242:87-383(-)
MHTSRSSSLRMAWSTAHPVCRCGSMYDMAAGKFGPGGCQKEPLQHLMIDLGPGNNNKINWPMNNKQELVDIIETVYRGARKGRGLVVSPKDYSTKYRY